MKRILVALDGSEHSHRSLELAITLARAMTSELWVVCALPPTLLASEFGEELAGYLDDQQRAAATIIEHAKAQASLAGVVLHGVIEEGTADQVISRVAEAKAVDLIVVGSHGRSAVGRILLGSVSDRLVHDCKRPVLVAR